jgi:hypothetical protein
MTVGDLWRILLRRWYVVVIAIISTILVLGQIVEVKPVYWTQVSMVFLRPIDAGTTNVLAGDAESLIHFAAIVERDYNGNHPDASTASPDATLFGEGIRVGSKVSLPNTGGQWETNFNQPALSIQVVDETPERATAVLAGVIDRIEAIVAEEQAAAGVSAANEITTSVSPSVPVVSEVGARKSRAVVATLILGALAAVSVAVIADRRLSRREIDTKKKRKKNASRTRSFSDILRRRARDQNHRVPG